jgi:hypothetical protein
MFWNKPKSPNYDALLANAMAHRQVKWINPKLGMIAVCGYVWQVVQQKHHWDVMLENGTKAMLSNQGAVFLAAHLATVEESTWN